jgi:hypothetical protein
VSGSNTRDTANTFNKHEIFALDESIEQYKSFDDCLLAAQHFNEELYSLAELVRGQSQSPPKKAKTTDVRPLVFVRFNSRMGKPKPITLKCLLDS